MHLRIPEGKIEEEEKQEKFLEIVDNKSKFGRAPWLFYFEQSF